MDVLPLSVRASHTRWGRLYRSAGLVSPYTANNLLFKDAHNSWNSGRYAPVTLMLNFDKAHNIAGLTLTPNMEPAEGNVEILVLVDTHRIPHASVWQDSVPVVIEFQQPIEARSVTIEFLRSPSWIALRKASIREGAPRRQPSPYFAVAAAAAADVPLRRRRGS